MISSQEQSKMEDLGLLEQAKTFVKRNVIPARDGRRCVDGRYQPATEDSGMIARPGGDAGYVEILLALNRKFNLGLKPEQCFDKIYEAITENGGTFYMHTDQHTSKHETEEDKIGCGHLAKATDPELCQSYELDSEDVIAIIKYAKRGIKEGKKIKMVDLPGEHQELWVFDVVGDKTTINSSDSREMGFVYDSKRDKDFMQNKLFPRLRLENVSYEDFEEESDKQLKATLHNLALGKQIIRVDADKAYPQIELIGKAV